MEKNSLLSFRIWDKKEKQYTIDNVATVYNNWAKQTFSITAGKRYVIEPCINRMDFYTAPIYVGDVLVKVDKIHMRETQLVSVLFAKLISDSSLVEHVKNFKYGEDPYGDTGIVYTYRTGIYSTPIQQANNLLWIQGERFGNEGELLEDSKDWLVVGTTHDPKWSHIFTANRKTFWENKKEVEAVARANKICFNYVKPKL